MISFRMEDNKEESSSDSITLEAEELPSSTRSRRNNNTFRTQKRDNKKQLREFIRNDEEDEADVPSNVYKFRQSSLKPITTKVTSTRCNNEAKMRFDSWTRNVRDQEKNDDMNTSYASNQSKEISHISHSFKI